MTAPRGPRVGLALGSGSARGWAHIGVIRALEQAGIRPDFVCGTSIGALVGAAYAAGELDRFEQCVLGLGIREVVGFMDVSLGSGVLKGERLMGSGVKQGEHTLPTHSGYRAGMPHPHLIDPRQTMRRRSSYLSPTGSD